MIAVMLLPVIIGNMLAITPKTPPDSKLTKRRLRTDAGCDGIEVDGLSPTGKEKKSHMHPKLIEQQISVMTISLKSPNNMIFILILLQRLLSMWVYIKMRSGSSAKIVENRATIVALKTLLDAAITEWVPL
jgi:hypothetical protein